MANKKSVGWANLVAKAAYDAAKEVLARLGSEVPEEERNSVLVTGLLIPGVSGLLECGATRSEIQRVVLLVADEIQEEEPNLEDLN